MYKIIDVLNVPNEKKFLGVDVENSLLDPKYVITMTYL